MTKTNLVKISNGAFIFCRVSMTLILWLAFFLKIKELILLAFVVFLFSVILKIKKAPMIVLYNLLFNKIIKTKTIDLNENGMRFAHSLGLVFSSICLLFLYFINVSIGWILVFIFACIKTVSAIGFCPGYKVYSCMASGGCCSFMKKK